MRDGCATLTPLETEFTSRAIRLIDVPTSTDFRVALRAYAIDASPGAAVVIRVYGTADALYPEAAGEDVLLRERTVSLNVVFVESPTEPGNRVPANAFMTDLLDGLASAHERVRIDITPADGTTRIWAFATVTNNDTQHVTVIAPK